MTENQVLHTPVPWVGRRMAGHDVIEILFSTLQESWGIRFYLCHAESYGCYLFTKMAGLARKHIESLSKLITEYGPLDQQSCYASDEELLILDHMLLTELDLRSKMVQELNTQVITCYPSQSEWDGFAEALQYLSSSHAALARRLRFLREWIDVRELNPVSFSDSELEAVA